MMGYNVREISFIFKFGKGKHRNTVSHSSIFTYKNEII